MYYWTGMQCKVNQYGGVMVRANYQVACQQLNSYGRVENSYYTAAKANPGMIYGIIGAVGGLFVIVFLSICICYCCGTCCFERRIVESSNTHVEPNGDIVKEHIVEIEDSDGGVFTEVRREVIHNDHVNNNPPDRRIEMVQVVDPNYLAQQQQYPIPPQAYPQQV